MTTRDQINALRTQLRDAFPERAGIIDGCLCAILAACHVLLLGVPGTAKSALVRAIASAFSCAYWERLFTRFTTPEEVFGPVSLRGLEQDRYERVLAGTLATAQVGFADEVFKANSSILNSLLTLINERTFHNGTGPVKCPLVSLFGASNELPEDKSLEALWDRFMVRYDVSYLVQDGNLRKMLLAGEPTVTARISEADLEAAQAEVAAVKISDATVDALIAIRTDLRGEGVVVSDRRWKGVLKLVKAVAWMHGESETTPEDLAILTDSLWREPKERAKIAAVVGKLADPIGAKIAEILDAARECVVAVSAKKADQKAYMTAAVGANKDLREQAAKLKALVPEASKRNRQAIDDATAEINACAQDFARAVSAGMGLRAAS